MGLTRITAQQISDIDYKQAVRVITLSNITLSGGAPATVDGVSLSLGDRILVASQSTGSQNGLYYVTTVGTGSNGTWARSKDGDATGEILAGMIVMVTEGTIYADTQWKLTTNDPIVIGTTALTFTQNSAFAFGNIYANSTAVLATTVGDVLTLTAGNNIQITGNNAAKSVTISSTAAGGGGGASISNGTSNVNVVSSGGNVTVGVGGTSNVTVFATTGVYVTGVVSASGQVTGSQFNGSGAGLTSIPGANVTGTVPSATSATSATTAGTVTTAAQGNITSVGTLTSLAVTGNITSGNLQGTSIVGTLTTAAQTNITSVGTLTAGTWNATSISTTYTDAKVTSVASRTGAVTLAQADISGLTTASTPTFAGLTVGTGTITGGNIVNSNANGIGNIGSATTYYNTVFAKATSAQYADLAENYVADQDYPIGTLLMIGGAKEVRDSQLYHDPKVVGTVSDKPAYTMNSGLKAEHVVTVALLGRVPCRVVGTIARGDLLVSSEIHGVATVLDPNFWVPGCVIGKALDKYSDDSPGVIEIMVGRY